MLRRVGRVLVVAALLATGACGDDGGSSQAESSDEPVRDRRITMPYTVTLAGDLDVRFDEEIEVRVMTVEAKTPEMVISLLSAGAADPFPLPSGGRLRAAFDLTGYKGDGSYTIQAGSPRSRLAGGTATEPGKAPDQSNVLVQHWATADTKQPPEVFDDLAEPCPLEVSEDGLRGVLRCTNVKSQTSGKSFSLEMRWGKSS